MPNLGLFANAGFPFTRHADLSSTLVVLPDDPSEEQIALYLQLLGFFGAETGTPALRLEVAQGNAAAALRGKDLLVIGSPEDQPLFRRWADHMPVEAHQLPLQAGKIGLRDRFRLSWRSLSEELPSLDSLVGAAAPPELLVQGFQSPEERGRSVVAFVTSGRHTRPKTLPLAWSAGADDVFGSVAVLEGEHFLSFPLVTGEYYTGMAAPREQLGYRLLDWFWFLPLLIIGLVLVLARLTRNWLEAHVRLRLGANLET
jgi:cellulose synthase (UDP-forming)